MHSRISDMEIGGEVGISKVKCPIAFMRFEKHLK